MAPQGGAVEHGHRLVGREIVAVINERGELEGGDLSIRGIAGNHIHLAIRQSPIGQAQIHVPRRRSKHQAIALGQPPVAILTIQELKAKARPPGWG
jgi:hypothetical protein